MARLQAAPVLQELRYGRRMSPAKFWLVWRNQDFAFGVPWLVADISFLAPRFRKPHLPLGEHRAQTRLSLLELMACNLVTAYARTKRDEPWLALVQLHSSKGDKCGVFWAGSCSVAWCCSGTQCVHWIICLVTVVGIESRRQGRSKGRRKGDQM